MALRDTEPNLFGARQYHPPTDQETGNIPQPSESRPDLASSLVKGEPGNFSDALRRQANAVRARIIDPSKSRGRRR